MKARALTFRLDPGLEQRLDRVCRKTGRSRSEVVREARRQLKLELPGEGRRRITLAPYPRPAHLLPGPPPRTPPLPPDLP